MISSGRCLSIANYYLLFNEILAIMNENKRVGIYGGTFDPIHNGHLNLAFEMMEIHGLDEIWFCPNKINPHKQDAQSCATSHRVKMLELALNPIPAFGILMNEIERKGISYTIDTLRELTKAENRHPYPTEIFLIVGDDSVGKFLQWKEPEKIVQMVPILVGKRSAQASLEGLKASPLVYESFVKGLTETKVMEISATDIRNRIRKKMYIGHLVPAKVVDYIYQNELYL